MKTKDKSKRQRGYKMLVNFSNNLIRRRAIAFTIAALICCAGVAIAVRAYTTKAPESKELSILAEIPIAAASVRLATQKKSEVEGEVVTLKKWGFEPREITRSKGKFLLYVNNQSQLTETLNFTVVGDNGTRLKEAKLDFNGKHKWDNLFDLNPGNYQLRVLEHPEWVCHFTITAN